MSTEVESSIFKKLGFSQDEIKAAMGETYDELISFVTCVQFKAILDELDGLDETSRAHFVSSVLLEPEELKKRGIVVPKDILIQRSAFGDRRPTLFCVKKYLPKKFHSAWENVNITFDALDNSYVSRQPEDCWRNPVRPDIQAALLAAGLSLEEIPESLQVNATLMNERWNAQPV